MRHDAAPRSRSARCGLGFAADVDDAGFGSADGCGDGGVLGRQGGERGIVVGVALAGDETRCAVSVAEPDGAVLGVQRVTGALQPGSRDFLRREALAEVCGHAVQEGELLRTRRQRATQAQVLKQGEELANQHEAQEEYGEDEDDRALAAESARGPEVQYHEAAGGREGEIGQGQAQEARPA